MGFYRAHIGVFLRSNTDFSPITSFLFKKQGTFWAVMVLIVKGFFTRPQAEVSPFNRPEPISFYKQNLIRLK